MTIQIDASSHDTRDLRRAFATLRREQPMLRQRDLADRLGVSEAEVVAARDDATPLAPRWHDLVRGLESLGAVLALTRNRYAVIETDGVYSGASLGEAMGQVLGDGIDLRLFLRRWASAFAVSERDGDDRVRRSIQIFDQSGTAVHKVHLRPHSDSAAFDALIAELATGTAELHVAPLLVEPEHPDREIDVPGLRRAWAALEDTHQFFQLTRRFRATRLQALRLAGDQWAEKLERGAFERVLEAAAASDIPLMAFVGSGGVTQIYGGSIHRVKATQGWINILDPGFNLHVRAEGVATVYLVRKPTQHGLIRSLEVFDESGREVLLVFGHRKAGERAFNRFAELVEGLRRAP